VTGPYEVRPDGSGWLLVGPTMPEEDGNWFSDANLVNAEAKARELNAAYEAGKKEAEHAGK
jgi:hypothetical protein